MANHYDPEYIRQQKQQQEEKERQEREQQGKVQQDKTAPQKPKVSKSVSKAGLSLRHFLGGEFLRRLRWWDNMPYLLMLFVMIIILIYINLLAASNQVRLEQLEAERIELNDKYIQIMEQYGWLQLDQDRKEALIEVYRNRGFVDDSSLVYMLPAVGKEVAR
ncbi:MAG: hypothetical protein IKN37_01505 [Bacteroidales bacterium]|nr:hypothetical protein [Bacteroidales bacterium]